jgi:hypothetical protein
VSYCDTSSSVISSCATVEGFQLTNSGIFLDGSDSMQVDKQTVDPRLLSINTSSHGMSPGQAPASKMDIDVPRPQNTSVAALSETGMFNFLCLRQWTFSSLYVNSKLVH